MAGEFVSWSRAIYWIRRLIWATLLAIHALVEYVTRSRRKRRVFYPLGGGNEDVRRMETDGNLVAGGPAAEASVSAAGLAEATPYSDSGDIVEGFGFWEGSNETHVGSDVTSEILLKDDAEDLGRSCLPSPNITPICYKLRLTCLPPDSRFEGQAGISIVVNKPTDLIELNAKCLSILEVVLMSAKGNIMKCAGVETEPAAGKLKILLKEKLGAKSKWVLTIRYSGSYINAGMGLDEIIYGKYTEQKCVYVAQFEDFCCSSIFPCYNQPEPKSTFELTLEIPPGMLPISNADICRNEVLPSEGNRLVTFDKTPLTSPHLLSFVVGDYEYVERYTDPGTLRGGLESKPVRCRVYFFRGDRDLASFALTFGCRVLGFLEEYTQIPYPLSKIDQVILPITAHPSTSGWGLAIHSIPELLKDATGLQEDIKHILAKRICYTFASQWFGNLVSMKYWHDLWFSEAISSLMSHVTLENIHSDPNNEYSFISNELELALGSDSLKASECVKLPQNSRVTAQKIFDKDRRLKCTSVLRMVYLYAGEEVFRSAIRSYLHKYEYQCVFLRDFWYELKDESGTDIDIFIDYWLEKPGYPLVKVVDENYDSNKQQMTLTLQQRRYYSLGVPDENNIDDGFVWWIPLGLVVQCGRNRTVVNYIFSQKESNFTFPYVKKENSYWKLNAGSSGLYRVCVKQGYIEKMIKLVMKKSSMLGIADRMQLISDTFALYVSGEVRYFTLLDLLTAFKNEDNVYVLKMIKNIIFRISDAFRLNAHISGKIEHIAALIFKDKMDGIDLCKLSSGSLSYCPKRELVISVLAHINDRRILDILKTMFEEYCSGKIATLAQPLRRLVFIYSIKNPATSIRSLGMMMSMLGTKQSIDVACDAICALGACSDPEATEHIVNNFIVNSRSLRRHEVMILLRSLAAHNPNRGQVVPLLKNFLLDNWIRISERYRTLDSISAEMLETCLCVDETHESIQLVKDWIKGNDLEPSPDSDAIYANRRNSFKTTGHKINAIIERMAIVANWKRRHEDEVNGYIGNLNT